MARPVGFEPTPTDFGDQCATNYTTSAYSLDTLHFCNIKPILITLCNKRLLCVSIWHRRLGIEPALPGLEPGELPLPYTGI